MQEPDKKDYYAKSPEFGRKLYALVKDYWNDINADSMVGHLHLCAHLVARRRFNFTEKRNEQKRNGGN